MFVSAYIVAKTRSTAEQLLEKLDDFLSRGQFAWDTPPNGPSSFMYVQPVTVGTYPTESELYAFYRDFEVYF